MPAATSVRAPITPAVLTWAIDSLGLERADVARSAQVSVETLALWEGGDERPTLNQLRDLANKVKRPYPVFFLHEPPQGTDTLPDLRTRGSLTGEYSPALRLEIRRARYYQTLVADHQPPLLEPAGIPRASEADSPQEAAAVVRAWLGVDLAAQRGFKGDDRGFAQWRSAFLEKGVLSYVFRLEAREEGELAEALGFCLPSRVAPLVAVNGEGAPAERVFGLFHELGHLVLGTSGVSAAPLRNATFPSETERWCNRFANRCLLTEDASLEGIVAGLPTDAKAEVERNIDRMASLMRNLEDGFAEDEWLEEEMKRNF